MIFLRILFLLIGVFLWIAAEDAVHAAGNVVIEPGGGAPPQTNAFVCPDLASTDLFRSKGLEYVHTLAFAEAMATVASGASPFAPPPVPEEWKTFTAQWYLHLVSNDAAPFAGESSPVQSKRFSSEEETCDPVLLHKASLEYRARPGNGKVAVIPPYYPPMGAAELEENIGHIDELSNQVQSKIGTAERLGAAQCSPSDLARVEKALESARKFAAAHHYDPDYAERSFVVADRMAEELVRNRQFATSKGFVCYSHQ
jgi:hypothetical protein